MPVCFAQLSSHLPMGILDKCGASGKGGKRIPLGDWGQPSLPRLSGPGLLLRADWQRAIAKYRIPLDNGKSPNFVGPASQPDQPLPSGTMPDPNRLLTTLDRAIQAFRQ